MKVSTGKSVLDLLKVETEDNLNFLEPLGKGEQVEFDMENMRNSVTVPPFMLQELLTVDPWCQVKNLDRSTVYTLLRTLL